MREEPELCSSWLGEVKRKVRSHFPECLDGYILLTDVASTMFQIWNFGLINSI